MTEPRELVAYCGLYCGACAIYQGQFKQRVEALRSLIRSFGFDKIMGQLAGLDPAFKHYSEFEQVMEALVKVFGDCPGCIGGGGDPACKIRPCASEKGYTTCAECGEMDTCEALKQYPGNIKMLRSIKQQGLEAWLEEMQKKVEAGFCYQAEE